MTLPTGSESRSMSVGGDVLGEVAGIHVEALGLHRADRLLGEQANLTVPVACVGIALEAAIEMSVPSAPGVLRTVFFAERLTDVTTPGVGSVGVVGVIAGPPRGSRCRKRRLLCAPAGCR